MPPGSMSVAWLCICCCLLLGVCTAAQDVKSQGREELEDWEWGSGSSLLHLLQNFPADSPFASQSSGRSVNCTQHFSLPPSSPICWENIAGPREFARSRLLVLQNRAALEAVSTSSGVEEGGFSYDHLAKEEVLGIRSDHRDMEETLQTMETVFVSLAEKRKEGKDQGARTSMREYLATTRDAIDSRTHTANHLEMQLSYLENTLLNVQLRLHKLIRQ